METDSMEWFDMVDDSIGYLNKMLKWYYRLKKVNYGLLWHIVKLWLRSVEYGIIKQWKLLQGNNLYGRCWKRNY